MSGMWFRHPASAADVFEMDSDRMWQMILREMGG